VSKRGKSARLPTPPPSKSGGRWGIVGYVSLATFVGVAFYAIISAWGIDAFLDGAVVAIPAGLGLAAWFYPITAAAQKHKLWLLTSCIALSALIYYQQYRSRSAQETQISKLATKTDIDKLATITDIAKLASKEDVDKLPDLLKGYIDQRRSVKTVPPTSARNTKSKPAPKLVPTVDSILNAASQEPWIAPGSLAAAEGRNFLAEPGTYFADDPSTSFHDVTIELNGKGVDIVMVSNTRIHFEVPIDVLPGTVSVVVHANGQSSKAIDAIVKPNAPGIFELVNNRVAGFHGENGAVSLETPAKVGSTIVIFATGLGMIDTPQSKPTVLVGGKTADAAFVGLAPGMTGLYQINVKIPELPAGDHLVQVNQAGVASNRPSVRVAGKE
jgi:uncharacterized protein (TIGR03437 family)